MQILPEVAEAIAAGRPVVALESTIISHGLPRPRNLQAAHDFEQILRDRDVVPATIAVVDGEPHVGLTASALERVALDESVVKVSVRDLPVAMATGASGATTVAATAYLAAKAGIRVFSTGGLGGVHRGASATFDESADLTVLARTPITVVSAGVKSILDIPATLERLETLSVTVVGYGTDRFPSFWLTESGETLDWAVPDADGVAAVMAANDVLGRTSAVLVANPLPYDKQLDPQLHHDALAQALAEAERDGISGKDVSPYLLARIVELTRGSSLEVNLDIAANNIAVGADIARSWSVRQQ
ncbi:pseudouridine-5'-phosphate glycosidase [Mumia zhuanghuii]|uniref:Pseudouridine-5'-phosphate glycosidase n=1 Tax=Mumia zhuanghuii TaxID=2585211 RepID=A0A5C4MML1_9ACTN|nr:pseudouridine-5'-phosphate glycosidase [Mumia zhuanghuii]TNC47053.1 pseudouridine-5'-phosphate glycosidase [Mumia zhuanghuii]TNC50391.1 pseudouridine-5'-phosphate glycosidase [Mumia zhuanghuii]